MGTAPFESTSTVFLTHESHLADCGGACQPAHLPCLPAGHSRGLVYDVGVYPPSVGPIVSTCRGSHLTLQKQGSVYLLAPSLHCSLH